MSEKKNKHQYNDNFKFKVALAALKGDKTIAALCKEFNLHETQITRWKKQLRDNGKRQKIGISPFCFTLW